MKKILFSYFVFQFYVIIAAAQNVSGSWYGVGFVDVSGSSDNFLTELVLTQKGKQVTGELNYYFRDSLFTNKISGNFDIETRRLTINDFPIVYYKSVSTLQTVDCPMKGDFQLRVSKTESVLSGGFYSDKSHQYTCPGINFKLKKQTDSITPIYVKNEREKEEVAEIKEDSTPLVKTIKPLTQEEVMKVGQFNLREKYYVETIDVISPVIKVELYDNGYIDGDSISVFLNNTPVITKAQLAYGAIRLTINLDKIDEVYELSMYAENLGTVPPNTALVVLYDGANRHEINLSSDFEKTATIRLRRKKVQ